MLEVVGMKEIDAIFEVTDGLGVHREMLVIPLGPATPGRVRRLPSGKFEITVDAHASHRRVGEGAARADRRRPGDVMHRACGASSASLRSPPSSSST